MSYELKPIVGVTHTRAVEAIVYDANGNAIDCRMSWNNDLAKAESEARKWAIERCSQA